MRFEMTRRKFVVASIGIGVSPRLAGGAANVGKAPRAGTLYGRTVGRGIASGGTGEAVLMDGSRLTVSLPGRYSVRPGKSLLVSSGDDGTWTVLYAEV